MDEKLQKTTTGQFSIGQNRAMHGELSYCGRKTSLYVEDSEPFDPWSVPHGCIHGVSRDQTKISLLDCHLLEGLGRITRGNRSDSFARYFPHFILSGQRHLSPDDEIVEEIGFVVDDGHTLFYDFDAFGSLLYPESLIGPVVEAHAHSVRRKIEIGDEPQVLYFSGKREIVAAETALGRISAKHNPSFSTGGPQGVRVDNKISVQIAFHHPVKFGKAISGILTTLRFLEIIVGRPQNVSNLGLVLAIENECERFLSVNWSVPPRRIERHQARAPHVSDNLIQPCRNPKEFCSVLSNWLERHESRQTARARFADCFAKQGYYDTERLVAAANMFDVLPEAALPSCVEISEALLTARDQARATFESLEQSPERDSILGALGRIGKATLRSKIGHRAQLVLAELDFPELALIVREAVRCRNHFVHGSDASFSYDEHLTMVTFFCDALEFIFAASDLIESGWDAKRWAGQGTVMAHPFAQFRVGYTWHLDELKALLR